VTSQTTTKFPITLIELTQAEGNAEDLTQTKHTTWGHANERLRNICNNLGAKKSGVKVDFFIRFSNAETYKGTFFATHPHNPNHERAKLNDHIKEHLLFMAGLHCPPHMEQADYDNHMKDVGGAGMKNATEFLKLHSFEDTGDILPPPAKPSNYEIDVQNSILKIAAIVKTVQESADILAAKGDTTGATKLRARAMQLRKAMIVLDALK